MMKTAIQQAIEDLKKYKEHNKEQIDVDIVVSTLEKYFIPIEQQQADEWDEAERLLKTYACNADGNIGVLVKPIDIINIFKPHFNLTKK